MVKVMGIPRNARLGAVLVSALVLCSACGGGDSESASDSAAAPGSTGGEPTAAEQKTEALGALDRRREALVSELQKLRSRAEGLWDSEDDPLREAIAAAESGVGRIQSQAQTAASAADDQWKAASSELESALDRFEKQIDSAAAMVNGRQQVLDQRGSAAPLDPATGLFQGLDGEDYEIYRKSVVRDVQLELRRKGYYNGPADGFLGRPTMEAVAKFQEESGVLPTGVPSPKTRARLFGQAEGDEAAAG